MGDSYRDYIKGRKRAGNRARATTDLQTAIEARARAIKEQNRKAAAKSSQYQARLNGFEQE